MASRWARHGTTGYRWPKVCRSNPPAVAPVPVIATCFDVGDPLAGTFSNKTGNGTALPSSVTFHRTAGNNWISNTFFSPCPFGPPSAGLTFWCSGPDWHMTGGGGITGSSSTTVSANSTTKTVVLDFSFTGFGGCAGTARITIQG